MLFASDLDNTLIHSYKTARAGDICVEVKDGKELSFMPPAAHALLRKVADRCLFVPVTTRSLEQYRRLDLGVKPRYAVVAHGALLLADGEVDEVWRQETKRMLGGGALPRFGGDGTAEGEGLIYDIRYVDRFFMFAKSERPLKAVAYLQGVIDRDSFGACAVYNKVYVFPRRLNKGAALDRLKRLLPSQRVICAGDSQLDLPMLEKADTAIAPRSLGLRHEDVYALDEASFTEDVLHRVMGLMEEPEDGGMGFSNTP